MTYHTKYDVDLLKALRNKRLSRDAVKIMISNIQSCDEVWTVSRGAGENLKSLGYKGDYIIMPNGVDLPLGRVSDAAAQEAAAGYDLPADVPVFLFIGRMFWYKGIRLILDALDALRSQHTDFRMVFVGDGADFNEIKAYTSRLGLNDRVFFTGALRDREKIRAWYCRADLFLFPSTYDTNGLVVREAASCSLPSVLVRDSCAAEDVTEDRNGFLISETAASLAVLLYRLCRDRGIMKRVGEYAAAELYLSWADAVSRAYDRYETVIDNYRAGRYPRHRRISDTLLQGNGDLMNALSRLQFGEE
jgi:glycosyltransferase involved in cell wall biosynthesis